MRKLFFFCALALSLIVVSCSFFKTNKIIRREMSSVDHQDYYLDKVQPVLTKRCAVCHACWNAPCQLNLENYDGVDRGATKTLVYGLDLKNRTPTRLGIDAHSSKEWQSKHDFFPVLDKKNKEKSMMYQMLKLHKEYYQKADWNPKKETKFIVRPESDGKRICPENMDEFESYKKVQAHLGMPYNLPPLKDEEYQTLMTWMDLGAPGPSNEAKEKLLIPSSGSAGYKTLDKWEIFFNQTSPKEIVTSRYLYEHLFRAHIHFKSIPGDFYRLIRSKSPSPKLVSEINSRRPYDPPGVKKFYYRFKKVTSDITHKTHNVFHFNDKIMQRWKDHFFGLPWGPGKIKIPKYHHLKGSNPFIVFKQVPAEARYRFMIENAVYIWQTILRGSSCRASKAINVIPDRFIHTFLDPKSDLSVTDPDFLPAMAKDLKLPALSEGSMFHRGYGYYKRAQKRYTKKREKWYRKKYPNGFAIKDIWDGNGKNKNAIVSVIRSNEGGEAYPGIVGGIPRKTGILDYPIFERLYYNLTVNWDVWGSTYAIVKTRLYTDNIRVEGEDAYLSVMPKKIRNKMRKSWYQGFTARLKQIVRNPFREKKWGNSINYQSNDPHTEFWKKVVRERMHGIYKWNSDPLNNLNLQINAPKFATEMTSKREVNRALKKLSYRRGTFASSLPEISFLRVKRKNKKDFVYTIFRDTWHDNVSHIFFESKAMKHWKDTVHFSEGITNPYPNFFFEVDIKDFPNFVRDLHQIKKNGKSKAFFWVNNHPTFRKFVDNYGIRKGDPRLWDSLDWFTKRLFRDDPVGAGQIDLLRYHDY